MQCLNVLFPRAMVGLAFWLAATVSATQFVPLSIAELTQRAQLIVHATVLDKACAQDAAGRVYTRVKLQVQETWKGQCPGNPLLVVHGGGVVGRKHAVVSGQVEYGISEEVVAFLVINGRGEAVTLGLAQGKFAVWADPASGEKLVRNLFHGAGGNLGSSTAAPSRVAPEAGRLTLGTLKQLVQQAKEATR